MPWQRAAATCRLRVDYINRASIQLSMSAMTTSLSIVEKVVSIYALMKASRSALI
jgi:hypothetical protein